MEGVIFSIQRTINRTSDTPVASLYYPWRFRTHESFEGRQDCFRRPSVKRGTSTARGAFHRQVPSSSCPAAFP